MIYPLLNYLQGLRKRKHISRLGLLLLLVVSFDLLMTAPAWAQESAQAPGFNPQFMLKNALAWIDSQGSFSAIAFISIYIGATVALFPGSILTLGAGVVFGVILGSLYVFVGATLGAIAAFLVGRYLARDWVTKKIEKNSYFKAINEAVGREGFKIVLLTRLSPIIPFVVVNYFYGVTRVSLKNYVLGSLGIIPGTLLYVYIGSLAGNLATIETQAQPLNPGLQWTIRVMGFIVTVVLTLYITKIARRALDDAISN